MDQKRGNRTTSKWYTGALIGTAPSEVRGAAIQKICSALRISGGNVSQAARILELSAPTLYRLVRAAPELSEAVERAREVRS